MDTADVLLTEIHTIYEVATEPACAENAVLCDSLLDMAWRLLKCGQVRQAVEKIKEFRKVHEADEAMGQCDCCDEFYPRGQVLGDMIRGSHLCRACDEEYTALLHTRWN